VPKVERQRFELVLRDAGADGDADLFLRLRAVPKRLLRSYSLRCVSIRELKLEEPAAVTDALISEALDAVAAGLDRVASGLCDLDAGRRAFVLGRLRRLGVGSNRC
jgi:hypothetical protein